MYPIEILLLLRFQFFPFFEVSHKWMLKAEDLHYVSSTVGRPSLLWIRICFNADPDPAFFVNADPDTDPDPDPGFDDLKLEKIYS